MVLSVLNISSGAFLLLQIQYFRLDSPVKALPTLFRILQTLHILKFQVIQRINIYQSGVIIYAIYIQNIF